MASGSKKAVYAAIGGNFAIAVTKFLAAAFTGSVAMLAEGIHSLVDTGNGGLLLLGISRSKQPPDAAHPFGYGKELYFWTLIVAIMIFALGGGISIYEGVLHVIHPVEMRDPRWNYWVLAFAMIFEGFALTVAYREFRKTQGSLGILDAVRKSKDPTTFTVVIEDSAAMLGLIVAFVGIYLGQRFQYPALDGIASIVIGSILVIVALFLAYECKSLLIGEGADPETLEQICRIARADPGVENVRRPLTMHFGPHMVLLTMDVEFRKGVDVVSVVDRLEKEIRTRFPEIKQIFLEAEAIGDAARKL